jgi:dephospho-CoA kinase
VINRVSQDPHPFIGGLGSGLKAPFARVSCKRVPMKLVGLGGGIGSGKSTVSGMLAQRGAVIVDADLIARQVVEVGSDGLALIVERFGAGVVRADGTLDRAALAGIVFSDKEALAALNAITHPRIREEINAQIEAQTGTDRVVVLDAALLFDTPRDSMVGRMTVDVDPEVAVERLVAFRGFAADDARNRIRNQMSREDRRAAADFVIDNSGTTADLAGEVDRAWEWITSLAAT